MSCDVDAMRQMRLVRMRQEKGGKGESNGRLRSISRFFKK